jgi:hypothetical protein
MKTTLFVVVALLTMMPTDVGAQGQSSLRITSINVSPQPFKAGDVVTVTLEVTSPVATGNGIRSYFSFYKSNNRLEDMLGGGHQSVQDLAAGEKRQIVFTDKWVVPKLLVKKIYLFVGVYDPPNEFARERSLAYVRGKCSVKVGCEYALPTVKSSTGKGS